MDTAHDQGGELSPLVRPLACPMIARLALPTEFRPDLESKVTGLRPGHNCSPNMHYIPHPNNIRCLVTLTTTTLATGVLATVTLAKKCHLCQQT